MSIFQCSVCGCAENTANCNYHYEVVFLQIPPRCSGCTEHPKDKNKPGWHMRFERIYLPLGMFVTNRDGNLAHKVTGDTYYQAYRIAAPPGFEESGPVDLGSLFDRPWNRKPPEPGEDDPIPPLL